MVSSCSISGCTSRQNKEPKNKGLYFFSYPMGKRQRTDWIKATDRKDRVTGGLWEPGPGAKICSRHFEDGWVSDDHKDTNYRPTLFLKPPVPIPQDPTDRQEKGKTRPKDSRAERAAKRKRTQEADEKKPKRSQYTKEKAMKTSLRFHSYCGSHHESFQSVSAEDEESDPADCGKTCDASVMTEESSKSYEELQRKVGELEKEIKDMSWNYRQIENDDTKTKLYTGLPTFKVFMWLFSFLEAKARAMTYWGKDDSSSVVLPLIDQLFATLMRLRLGLFIQDLADRFRISKSMMSTIVTTWIFLLYKELEPLNPCPSREILDQTMPPQYHHMKGLRFIIDCTEIRVDESPSRMSAQSYSYPNYKHHTTVKFLVASSPTGVITYASDPWEGRVSEREITQRSGFLNLLQQGDLVLADKGFTIGDLVNKEGAFLNIPPSLMNSQLTVQEVYMTKLIAQVRIHVKRAIGRVKEYRILDGVMPLSLRKMVGSIFKVCCWLSNLHEPLVNPK